MKNGDLPREVAVFTDSALLNQPSVLPLAEPLTLALASTFTLTLAEALMAISAPAAMQPTAWRPALAAMLGRLEPASTRALP
jgi:hypothetical protein